MNSSDDRFVQHIRELYREAAQQVDPATSARLRAARAQALATPRHDEHGFGARWLVPGGAFAAIALAAVVAWQPLAQLSPHPTVAVSSAVGNDDADADLPPDADQTDPQLYQNLDFYGWLAANDSRGSNR